MTSLTCRTALVARLLPAHSGRLTDLALRRSAYAGIFLSSHPVRHFNQSRRLPHNTGVLFVPQQEAWVIERFGKFSRILSPGLNFCIPVVDRIAYIQSLKEIPINIPDQPAITVDNVTLQINGVLFLKVFDPYQASYGIEDAEFAMTQLAQTTMRSELGKISLDSVFRERDNLNRAIVEAINQASEPWGINCLRYEIRDIILPPKIKDAMQTQVEADRRKRAAILESEGIRNSDINVAEGKKQAQILASEAFQREVLNRALGESEAIVKIAEAKASAIRAVSEALSEANGSSVVAMTIAEKYIEAFGKLAKSTNTVLLPAHSGDVASMVAQALAIYKTVDASSMGNPATPASPAQQPPTTPQSTTPPPTTQASYFQYNQKSTSPSNFAGGDGSDFASSPSSGEAASMEDPASEREFSQSHYQQQPQQQQQQLSRAEQIERDMARAFGQFGGYGSGDQQQQYHQQQQQYHQQQHQYHQQQQHQHQQQQLRDFDKF